MARGAHDLDAIRSRVRIGLGGLAVIALGLLATIDRLSPGTPLLVYLLAGVAFIGVTGVWRLVSVATWRPFLMLLGAVLIGSVGLEVAWEGLERVQSERTHGGDPAPFYPRTIWGLLIVAGTWVLASKSSNHLIGSHRSTAADRV